MEPVPQEIIYTNEFADWEDSLRGEFRGQLRVRLVRTEKGNFGKSHSVGEGVARLVFNDRPGSRVYFGRSGNKVILLTGGDQRHPAKRYSKGEEDVERDQWRSNLNHTALA